MSSTTSNVQVNKNGEHLEEAEPEHDICCGCGEFNDTREECDCGCSHRAFCKDCEKDESSSDEED